MAKVWEPTETLRPEMAKVATISLQRPREGEHWQQFKLELGYWFPALKWLIKEFRLHIGYETPDEEAGVRFWLEQFSKRRKSADLVASEPTSWLWPTADEPVMKATKSEVQQARTWKLEDVERAITRFFDLRRQLCPATPILVPLNELRLHSVQTQQSSKPELIRLHLKEARRASPTRSPKSVPGRSGSRSRARAKALSREVRERLYPRSPALRKNTPLSDEMFVSRLIDVAMLCDGDPEASESFGRSEAFGRSVGSRWFEGACVLDTAGDAVAEEQNLVSFWQRLRDKESFGLGFDPGRVANAVQERLSSRHLAERVFDAFVKKFGCETLDAKVLFNFWLTMPAAVRSSCHVRGHPDRQVLEGLEEFVRRKEGRQKEPWRPVGSACEDSLCGCKALSREVRETLYPRSPVVSKQTPWPDEMFVSRLIDVAALCDGNPEKASTELLRRLDLFPAEVSRWFQGPPLEELDLVNFWQRLRDKESFGLGFDPGRVANAVQERLSCRCLGERVFATFVKKFGYETFDLIVLFNFWLTMPAAVRSSCHVRGHPDRQVLESLEEFLRLRKEGMQKATVGSQPRSARKEPWRPAGPSCEDGCGCKSCKVMETTLPPAPETPRGRSLGLELLSRPKRSAEAFDFLKALTKRYQKDTVLKSMLKQCLAGGGYEKAGSLSTDAGDDFELLDAEIHKLVGSEKEDPSKDATQILKQWKKDPPPVRNEIFRLAPPLFKQSFLEIFRKAQRKAKKEAKKANKIPPVPRFWSSSVNGQSFNMVVFLNLVRRQRKNHDFKWDEQQALLKMAVRTRPTSLKEFRTLQKDMMMVWRQHLFAKVDDARECTFHPQTAANVPPHVLVERDRISDRMDPMKTTSITDFVKEIGENYDGPKYAKYRHVRRHHMLSQAKAQYVKGALNDALTKLKSSFGVLQILDRFRCHHKGCGKKLDTSQNIKKCDRCSGFYCSKHKSKAVHNCEAMKEIIKAKAKQEAEHVGEGDKSRPPEENFDNKVEFGLLLEARDLAENIINDLQKKEKAKHELEHLGQSLASFGAVRILERPFRRQMCQSALERRKSEGKTQTPRLGRSSSAEVKCKCPKAHSPSELRFPAAESVSRRVAWVKEAVNQAVKRSDVRPNSAAERSKRKKEEEERKKAPPPPPLPDKGGKTRAPSKPRATEKLEKHLKEKAGDLQHAFGLCCEARVKLEASLLADAEQLIQQAKNLAEDTLKEAIAAGSQQGDGRGTSRAWEKKELKQLRASLQQEAQETVELCEILEKEAQMLRQQLACPPPPYGIRLPSPPPRPPQWSPPSSPGAPRVPRPPSPAVKALDDEALMRLLIAGDAPPPTHTGPQKREMCLEFLEAGVCTNEHNCPFAHNPDELYGYQPRWSPGQFNSAQHVAGIDQILIQSEQQRQQELLARRAVSDRSAFAPSSPATKRW